MIPPDKQGYALKRGERRSIDFRGVKITVKMPGAQVGESYSLIEMMDASKEYLYGSAIRRTF